MAGSGPVLVAAFALLGISLAVAQSGPSKVPHLCLSQQLTEVAVLVEASGISGCPGQEDIGNQFTETVENWIYRNVSFGNCSIVGGRRLECNSAGRRVSRTNMKYRVNVTCGSENTMYVGNREALQHKNRAADSLLELLREKPVIRRDFEGNTVEMRFFRGRKVHYSECTAGVYGSVKEKLDICFCPSEYQDKECALPPESGPCRAYFPRYFYNSSSGQCDEFIYGGCQGNENNFLTSEECLVRCTECPEGKTFSSCGPGCPRTCANKDLSLFCTALCKKGCFCAEGFVEHEGECLRPESCPNSEEQCPGDKVFTTCGSHCPVTCNSVDNPPSCINLCVEGCYCPAGTIQMDSNSDSCVLPKTCPRQGGCPDGKVFKTCGSSCPRTCQNKDDVIACTQQCVTGCFCPDGQVELGSKCVTPGECPVTDCPDGKRFRECGTACPRTCDTLGDTALCSQVCVAGCFCPPGFVESGDKCVHPRECQCPQGKEYQQCGTACPRTCDNKDELVLCTLQCVEGCFCPSGLVEHDGGCVEPSQCPATEPECPKGKEYQQCGTDCPSTCDNKDDIRFCAAVCRPGCFCPSSYVEQGTGCVLPEECPDRA